MKILPLKLLIVIGLSLSLCACAESASTKNMAVYLGNHEIATNPALKEKVAVRSVIGGQDTSPLWKSRVDNAGFKAALEESLSNLGYTAPEGKTPKYFIDANLQSIDQPSLGLTLDISSTVTYSVEGPNGTKNYPVTAMGSASVSDKFMAVQRLKMANERSIQENIKAFLTQLGNETKKEKK